ncbi:MAG: molecular chaperone TorD family protein [Anaerolineae bacterium]|nr:molecular chaperone TorD family protein [Anaerolineae bacterium]
MQPKREFTAADWASFLTGEALAGSLLGRLIYAEPEKAWLQSLADEDIFAESPFGNAQPDVQRGLDLLQSWAQVQRGSMSDEAFDDLRVDYTRLLTGAGNLLAPPWESVYFNDARMVFQEQTMQVRAWYHRFDLEAPKYNAEPDDHIGLELIFVAHLAQETLVALDQQDQSGFETMLATQREFLSEHLLTWAFEWCKLVEAHANTDFFRGIALLTRGVLTEIAATLQVQPVVQIKL